MTHIHTRDTRNTSPTFHLCKHQRHCLPPMPPPPRMAQSNCKHTNISANDNVLIFHVYMQLYGVSHMSIGTARLLMKTWRM